MKTTGPMFSLDASGSIGGILTASKWKGRSYFRTLVKPSNPKTAGQVANRAMLKFLSQSWANLTSPQKANWDQLAANLSISPFNAYVKENQRRWTNVLTPSVNYPAGNSDIAGTESTPVLTAGVKMIQVALTITALNQNFGIWLCAQNGGGPSMVKSETLAIVEAKSVATFNFMHTGLTTGDVWHYIATTFSLDGVVGAATVPVQATVL